MKCLDYLWRPACSPFPLFLWSFSSCHRLFVCCHSPPLPLWQRWSLTLGHCDRHLNNTHMHAKQLVSPTSSQPSNFRASQQHVKAPSEVLLLLAIIFQNEVMMMWSKSTYSEWCSKFSNTRVWHDPHIGIVIFRIHIWLTYLYLQLTPQSLFCNSVSTWRNWRHIFILKWL